MLEGNPDLYGPFWIATTVVLILFLGGTISQYLSSTGQERFAYDFKLLSGMSFYLRAASAWIRYTLLYSKTAYRTRQSSFLSKLAANTCLTFTRCRRSHIRLHIRHPRPPIPRAPVLRLRERQPPRVLGSVRLQQHHLDPRIPHQLVAYLDPQLRLRRRRLRTLGGLPAAQPIPSAERHRPPDQQGAAHPRTGAARGSSDRH